MSDPVPKGVKLHKSAPKGLLIVPESEWTDYDRRIWDAFDEIAGGIFMGTPPPHCTMAMGRMNGKPVPTKASIMVEIATSNRLAKQRLTVIRVRRRR